MIKPTKRNRPDRSTNCNRSESKATSTEASDIVMGTSSRQDTGNPIIKNPSKKPRPMNTGPWSPVVRHKKSRSQLMPIIFISKSLGFGTG